MARALSLDLRERVIVAIKVGTSCGQAAERFGVAKASAICWHARFGAQNEIAAKPMGGDRHSHRTEAHAAAILQAYAARPQIYLREMKDALEKNGATVSLSGLSRFFRRHGITRKKRALHAAEQGRPDEMQAREAWFKGQLDLDPERVVFLDETATATITAVLRTSGSFAVHLMDGATNGTRFLSYATNMLVPALTPSDTMVMDNLAAYKVAGVRQAIEAVEAHLRYLSAYSPDFNLIEQAFAKKALLRTAAARTVSDLWAAIRDAFIRCKPDECRNYNAAVGYDLYDPDRAVTALVMKFSFPACKIKRYKLLL